MQLNQPTQCSALSTTLSSTQSSHTNKTHQLLDNQPQLVHTTASTATAQRTLPPSILTHTSAEGFPLKKVHTRILTHTYRVSSIPAGDQTHTHSREYTHASSLTSTVCLPFPLETKPTPKHTPPHATVCPSIPARDQTHTHSSPHPYLFGTQQCALPFPLGAFDALQQRCLQTQNLCL
jgi:hypothetical protein